MGLLSKIRYRAGVVCRHPSLAGWFLRNRLRVLTLGLERRFLGGISRFARGITFKPTWACNLRCKMCRFAESGEVLTSPEDVLPLEVWTSVVDDVARYKPYITLTGGEPLLYPDISALIRHITSNGLRCTLTTNGVALERRAPEFMDSPPDIVVVSVDGPAEVHDEVRQLPRAFERAIAGLEAVKRLRAETAKRTPLLAINSAITSYNYRRVHEMVDIGADLGADAVNYQHQWYLTRRMVDTHNNLCGNVQRLSYEDLGGAEPAEEDPQEFVDAVRRIRQRAEKHADRLLVTFHPDISDDEVYRWYADPHDWIRRRPAVCAWMNTDINPDGTVEPCFGMDCGNVTEKRFSEIWNDYPFRAYRRRLAQMGDLPVCVRCCGYFRRD